MTYKEWKESLPEEKRAALDTAVKKTRNKYSDRQQLERYKAVLGVKNMPRGLDKFQDLKYNGDERYNFIKLDYERQKRLIDHPEFALPNAAKATAYDRKFTEYLFNPQKPDGWAKGKAFISRLGYSADNYSELKSEILSRASKYPTKFKGNNGHSDLYEQRIVLYGKKEKPANVLVAWINDNRSTRMTTTHLD